MDEALRCRLLAMAAADRAARARAWPELSGGAPTTPAGAQLVADLRRVDGEHQEHLRQIVAERGWPSRSMVGEDGAHAAWLLAQHAPDHGFQRHVLKLLQARLADGEVAARDVAWLTDRVLVHEGERQRFGTQYFVGWAGTGAGARRVETLQAVDDIDEVNRRRMALGLGPARIPPDGIDAEPRRRPP